jgi:hypothetical protein
MNKSAIICIIQAIWPYMTCAQIQAPTFNFANTCGLYGARGEMSINKTLVDIAGNQFVIGNLVGTVTFGQTRLIAVGNEDVFVAKLSATGVYEWAVRAGGAHDDKGLSLALDSGGNVYIVGSFRSMSADFGTTILQHSCAGCPQTFVAKLSPSGVWLWAVQTDQPSSFSSIGDVAQAVAVDPTGSIYVAGEFSTPGLNLGALVLSNYDTTIGFGQTGSKDLYVAKLNPNGQWLWAVRGGGIEEETAAGLTVDGVGNVYVAGSFESNTATYGSTQLQRFGNSDLVVAKLDGNGSWRWAVRGGDSGYTYASSITMDSNNELYVAGRFTETSSFGGNLVSSAGYYDAFVAKLDATGNWLRVAQCGGASTDVGTSVDVDNNGNAFLIGHFVSDSITVGTTVLRNTSVGKYDVFAAKLDALGRWEWAVKAGGLDNDMGRSIALDRRGGVYLVGEFVGNGPAIFGALTIPGSSTPFGRTGYIARLAYQALTTRAGTKAPLDFTVFPNPTQGIVWIKGYQEGNDVRVSDITGRVVPCRITRSAGSWQLLLSPSIPRGIYLIHHGGSTRKLVLE